MTEGRRNEVEAALRSFGVDLLELAEQIGCPHIDTFVDLADGEPFVWAVANFGEEDEDRVRVAWFPDREER